MIEISLAHRVPGGTIAARFGVSADAIWRHRRQHLSPAVIAGILVNMRPSEVDLAALQKSEAEGLLARLIAQRARLEIHADKCFELGDPKGATQCERVIQTNLELAAKLLGQLVQRHETTSMSFLITPDFLKLRHAITRALEPFPEAARAVSHALHSLESDAMPKMIEHGA
jgi:hypothetical protein